MMIPKIDIHVHPVLKPYGHSLYPNNNPENPNNPASVWMVDKFTNADIIRENVFGFPTYRQSDFTSAKRSDVRLIVNSLYPIEKGFLKFKNTIAGKTFDRLAGVAVQELVTEFGRNFIELIRSSSYNYLDDLQSQLKYLQRLEAFQSSYGKFKILNNGSTLSTELAQSEDLLVVNSIEGIQSLCRGNNTESPEAYDEIESTIAHLKSVHGRPFFITFAHHFFNGLCSHSESLFSINSLIEGQQRGMDSLVAQGLADREINALGVKVIHLLLDTANGQRILVDVKHMSAGARQQFYQIRKADYPGVPIVYSHGATSKYPLFG